MCVIIFICTNFRLDCLNIHSKDQTIIFVQSIQKFNQVAQSNLILQI